MLERIHLKTIADLCKLFGLTTPVHHPLVAVVDFTQADEHMVDGAKVSAEFYTVMFKNYSRNNLKYGRQPIDFQDGNLICMAPNQVIEMDAAIQASDNMLGWGLFFHPDLISDTPLSDKMKDYNFFSYEMSEALHLSEKEKQTLLDCIEKIQTELQENIDVYSRNIIVSTIETLLNYCTRFYGRQFITRKSVNNSVVAQIEKILTQYFKTNQINDTGLPTVKNLAQQVNLSPSYLSDLLKKETGKNTQEHIHYYLIEEAKHILLSTDKSVGEIAYDLGFEYPQYFNKLFKQKTGKTPIQFRTGEV